MPSQSAISAEQLTRTLNDLSEKLSSLEVQIEQAVEQEDFELADSLQQQIEV